MKPASGAGWTTTDFKALLLLRTKEQPVTRTAAQAQTATETPAQPPTRSLTIAQDVLGNVAIVAPQGEPKRFVIFISDRDGLTAARQAERRWYKEKEATDFTDDTDFL